MKIKKFQSGYSLIELVLCFFLVSIAGVICTSMMKEQMVLAKNSAEAERWRVIINGVKAYVQHEKNSLVAPGLFRFDINIPTEKYLGAGFILDDHYLKNPCILIHTTGANEPKRVLIINSGKRTARQRSEKDVAEISLLAGIEAGYAVDEKSGRGGLGAWSINDINTIWPGASNCQMQKHDLLANFVVR